MKQLYKDEIIKRLLDMKVYINGQYQKEDDFLNTALSAVTIDYHCGRKDVFREVKEYLSNNFRPLV